MFNGFQVSVQLIYKGILVFYTSSKSSNYQLYKFPETFEAGEAFHQRAYNKPALF